MAVHRLEQIARSNVETDARNALVDTLVKEFEEAYAVGEAKIKTEPRKRRKGRD